MRFALLAVLSVAGFGLAMASVQFESVPFAWKASERSVISTAPGAVFGEPQSIELKQLAKTRITFGSSMMGQLYTGTGRSVDAWRCVDNCESIERGGATVSDNPTGFALYQVGSEMLGVAQFGEVPGVAQTFLIDRDANQKDNLQIKNGLTAYVWVESAGNPFGGLWRPVSAAASRWNTHLGTEDVPDAYQFEQFNCVASVGDPKPEEACLDSKDPNLAVDIMNMLRFQDYHPSDHLSALQDKRRDSTLNNFNLYKYGWVFEARPQLTSGAARLASQQKHYAMGRGGYQGIFTATNKVVYMTGGQGGLFRFIADASSDLSSGTLYGANYTYRAGGYDVEWTRLGSGSDDVLKGSPLNNAFSSNFFNLESENSNNCPAGSQFAAYWYNGGLRRECLKWTDDSNAPFFETNRYAASNGVDLTTFLFSGISASYLGQDGKIYITAKQVNALGAGPANSCGCVFSATLDNDQSINRLEPVLCGDSTAGTDSENVCNKDRLARPISVAVVPDYDMIVVGEEGGRTVGHYNPALWSINLNSRGALRMVTAPPHSSLMSGFFPQLQGQSWMPIAAAHPYQGITDTEILRNGTGPRAWLMYFGPITLDFSTASSDVAVFEPVTFPFGSVYAEKALLRGSRRITEGPHRSLPRRKLFSDGDRLGTGSKNATMGQLLDETGAPVIQLMDPGDTSSNSPIRSRTDDEDFTMEMTSATLIAQGQGCEDRKTIVVQYGAALPSMSYVLDVDFTGSTIQVDSAQVVNTTRIGGGWLLGAGVTSPWNTHVSGEVMDPDARIYSSAPCFNAGSGCLKQRDNAQYLRIMHFVRYFGFYQVEDVAAITKEQISAMYDPYRFGFVTEVKANVQGCVASKKLYNMGRFSHQGIAMMPDGKTVYMADSDNYGGLFRFRALQNGRLGSTGTLAVAQLQGDFDTSDLSKLDPRRERNYTIEWIELGTATSAEIEALVNDGTTFDDIWDFEEPTERSVGNSQNTFVCADGFTPVYLRQNTLNHPDIRPECLRLKSGMDKAAAFLETRRYAAFKGATMEFYMSGGMTFSEKASAMFLAVPTITLRMADNDGDGERFADGSFFGNNHIAGLDENNCGCVFRFPVNPQSFDTGRMEAYKCGRLGNQEVGDAPSGNQCSIERVASPRYLNSILGQDQLLVGEATGGGHQNAIVWGIDLLTGAQSRVVSSPEGEAAVATNIYQNVRGQDVVLIPVQGSDDANKAGGLYYLGPVDTFGTSDPVYLCYQFADEPAGVYECPEGVDLSSAPPSPPPISPPPPSPPPSPPPPPPSIAPPPDGGDGTPTSEPGFGNNGNGSTATIEPSSSPDGNNAHARHPLPFAAALAVLAAALLQALLTL